MKITAHDIQLTSYTTASRRTQTVAENTRTNLSDKTPGATHLSVSSPLSSTTRNGNQTAPIAADPVQPQEDGPDTREDSELRLIRLLLEKLTGHTIKPAAISLASDTVIHPSAQTPVATPETRVTERTIMTEVTGRLSFGASGSIQLENGQVIDLQLDLSMADVRRTYHQETMALGSKRLKDPLTIQLTGSRLEWTNRRFLFDLDGDGVQEAIHFASGNSAFLAADHNGNGRVDNGTELFGAISGDGFAELARFDENGNGFIDAGDQGFHQLYLYQKAPNGDDQLVNLESSGISAIFLGRTDTELDLHNDQGEPLARIRSSSFYIRDDYSAGTIHQVDLVV